MPLKRLVLTDFRNYRQCVWEPSSTLAVLTGENGAGKTNLLEAISLLTPGRGLRSAPSSAFCRQGALNWGVAGQVVRDGTLYQIGTGSDPSGNRRRLFRLDGETVRSQAEIGRIFSCTWLTPQMDRLFLESASGRRRFLDRLVMALAPDHAREMAAYERSVASRNRLLAERPAERAWLSSLEDSMSRHAVAVTAARLTLIERMNAHRFEAPGFPRSLLTLSCPIAERLHEQPALRVEDWLKARLDASRTEDRLRGGSSFGAHRADFSLQDAGTGQDASLLSSGQQKAMLVGVVLAHAELVAQSWGNAPALLLDEPLIHLDEKRQNTLLERLAGLETTVIMTGTERAPFSLLKARAEFVNVCDGILHPR